VRSGSPIGSDGFADGLVATPHPSACGRPSREASPLVVAEGAADAVVGVAELVLVLCGPGRPTGSMKVTSAASRGLEGLLQAGKRLEVDDFEWLRAVRR